MSARRSLQRALAHLWLSRITVIGREHLPARGPALYLGLHRNGAVDGFVHQVVLHRPTFLLAAQWRKGLLRRLLFDGIVVVRDKDAGDRSANARALQECVELLARGGELSVFPEGTSALGPRHLPFKTGAARILSAALKSARAPIAVLPIGLHYERAWAFRSRLEVVVGPPLDTALDPALPDDERVRQLHARLTRALEGVGLELASAAELERVEALACVATLGTSCSYFAALKAFEAGVPDDIARAWAELEQRLAGRRVLRHQRVPLVPTGSILPYALALAALGPLTLAALLVNLPPALAALWAGRALPDEPNVIALWRLLVGVPALLAWGLFVLAAALALHSPVAALLWAVLTLAGVKGWYRVKKLAVATHNALVCRGERAALLALHRRVSEHVGAWVRP